MDLHQTASRKRRWTVECECGWNRPGKVHDPKTWATEQKAKAAAAKHYLDVATLANRRADYVRETGIELPPGVSPPPRRRLPSKKKAPQSRQTMRKGAT